MGKSISNLYRYAEVSKACNQRFIDAMVDIVPVKSVQQEIASICSGKTVNGKHVPGFNVWSPDVLRIMETISDGRYLINGFRNKDIGKAIFPNMQDAKKRSSKTSRTLKKLRQHGLVKKVPSRKSFRKNKKSDDELVFMDDELPRVIDYLIENEDIMLLMCNNCN